MNRYKQVHPQKYIFDLGRNIAGISRIKVKGEAGTELRVTHSELLDENGVIEKFGSSTSTK